MNEESAYSEVNRKWKATCKIIFGDELGEMKDYGEWLSDNLSPRAVQRDASGREMVLSVPHYSKHTRWISFEEVDFEKKYSSLPISINEIKDIDSLLEAVKDRIYYTGNIVLGNSKFVEKSTGIFESFFAYHCERLAYCKYTAYATQMTSSECMFGSNGCGSTSFCIKIHGLMYSSRCFECSKVEYSTDCYYSHNLAGCQHCFFCFNLKNKRYCIGNLQLTAEKYQQIKSKLISEMREMLLKDKKLPSLLDFCNTPVPNQQELQGLVAKMPAAAAKEKLDQ